VIGLRSAIDTIRPEHAALNPVRLAVFCTIVECRSFSRAAERLAVTQPAVSAQVRTLETLLGAPLFERRRRGAMLTEAGRAVYEYAQGVLRDTQVLGAGLSDLAGGEAGTVVLGAPGVLGTYVLPGLLTSFQRAHLATSVRLRILPSEVIAEEVLRGALDVGIAADFTTLPASLHSEPLWAERMVLAARPDHPLAARNHVTVADLADELFVTTRLRFAGDEVLDAKLAEAGLPARRSGLEVDQPEGVKRALLAGAGLAIIARPVVAAELRAGALIALACDELPMVQRFRLVYRRSHRFSPLAQRLIAYLREEMPSTADLD
jgi:DNA-binding transcriptional LysR family regulator